MIARPLCASFQGAPLPRVPSDLDHGAVKKHAEG